MTFRVALTGGIASGKTTVSNEFARQGVTVIDADEVARDVVLPGSPALDNIKQKFGADALTSDGQLNRSFVRNKVFESDEHRLWLNTLLHPLIRECMLELEKTATSPYSLSVIPLLFESGRHGEYDRIAVVDVPESVQEERVMARDGCDRKAAQSILSAQASRTQRLSIANDVLYNDGDREHLFRQVSELHQKYLSLAASHHS